MSAVTPAFGAPLADVLTQHAVEAGLAWEHRARAVTGRLLPLWRLARADERVEANLDGLRIGGAAGWDAAVAELQLSDGGTVFTAAALAFESLEPAKIGEVMSVLAGSPELVRAAVSAAGWLEPDSARTLAESLTGSNDPLARRIAVGALAVQRIDPGASLGGWLRDGEPAVAARALDAAGELGRIDLRPDVELALSASDPDVRFAAAYSATLLASEPGLRALRELAAGEDERAERALRLVGRALPLSESLPWHESLAASAASIRSAGILAGAIGDPALVPWLLGLAADPLHARIAGDSLSLITGLDLAAVPFEAPDPAGFTGAPTDDLEDDDLALDPDAELSFFQLERVTAWWSQRARDFRTGVRHLRGRPVSRDGCLAVVREGRQHERAAAALELALESPGTPLFEVRARGERQLALLGT